MSANPDILTTPDDIDIGEYIAGHLAEMSIVDRLCVTEEIVCLVLTQATAGAEYSLLELQQTFFRNVMDKLAEARFRAKLP